MLSITSGGTIFGANRTSPTSEAESSRRVNRKTGRMRFFLRFFGGLSVDQVAQTLGVSKRTIESDWTMLKAWLRRELSDSTAS